METLVKVKVAIPSNRVNVSYLTGTRKRQRSFCRNPLKSGQCFLRVLRFTVEDLLKVAIPSNRVNVSYLRIVLFLLIIFM